MPEYLKILCNIAPLFLLIAIGAMLRQRRVLNAQADQTLLDLYVHLLLPCLILDHTITSDALRQSGNLWWSPLLGFLITTACLMAASVAARLWRFPHGAQTKTFTFVAGIFNYGYIPVPLVAMLFGANALAVLFLFNLGTEVAFWTVGFSAFMGHSFLRDWRRTLTTPVKAVLLGITINLTAHQLGIHLDNTSLDTTLWGWPVKAVLATIQMIGVCSIPLAVLLIGATMADFWGEFQRTRGMGVMGLAIAVRNGICPFGFLLFAWLLPVSLELKEVLVVQAAMPAGILPLVLARHHGGNVSVALQVIFATSAAAIITLPLWIHFGMLWIEARLVY
ncbi:MAG: AEC family transporter [Methylacidiphilales bacterium]|nr:AEC family transporter [Candidatus Methylacidiphilales bacterium]